MRRFLGLVSAALLAAAVLATAAPCAFAEETGSEVVAMGHNGEGELGVGFQSGLEVAADTQVDLKHVVQMSVGFNFGLAVVKEGSTTRAVSWGENNKGQLGVGKETKKAEVAMPITALSSGVTEVAAAGTHAMALKEGRVFTWGITQLGESGNGKPTEAEKNKKEVATAVWEPLEVEGLSGVVAIAAGGATDYALLDTGEVVAWGENANGQTGPNVKNDKESCVEGGTYPCLCKSESSSGVTVACSTRPVYISWATGGHIKDATSIAAGEESAYATTSESGVLAWGTNETGELGANVEIGKYNAYPLQVALPAGEVQQVAPGNHHVLGLVAGKVYGWGNNASGEEEEANRYNDLLGEDENTSELKECGNKSKCFDKPVELASLGSPSALGAGKASSFAIKEGKVYAWGYNKYGQLGVNLPSEEVTEAVKTPTLVKGAEGETIEGAKAVFGSEQRSAIMLSEGVAAPPLTITVETATEGSSANITVHWTFTFNGGYRVRACLPIGKKCTSVKDGGELPESAHSFKITGLTQNTEYEVQIHPPTSESEKNKQILLKTA